MFITHPTFFSFKHTNICLNDHFYCNLNDIQNMGFLSELYDIYVFIGPVFWLCMITISLMPLYRWVLPKIHSKLVHELFHILFGLFLTWILYRTDFLISLGVIVFTYFILDKNPYVVAFVAMGINLGVNFYQKMKDSGAWDFEITAIVMILFNRIVETSFNLYYGRMIKEGKTIKRAFNKKFALLKKPTFLEWCAYCLTPMGGNSGPIFEFKVFEYILTVGERPKISPDSKSRKQANLRFFTGIFWSIFNIIFINKVQISFYSQPWFTRQNVFVRFLLSMACTIGQICRYFPAWHPVEAGIYETGVCETALVDDFYDCSNMGLIQLLTTPSVGSWLQTWNHTSHIFFKRYLFYPLLDGGYGYSFAHHFVFVVSALWHGFEPVYLMCLPELIASSVADQLINKYFPSSSRGLLGNIFYHFFKATSMLNSISTFWYYTVDAFFFVRKSNGFIGTIMTFGVFIFMIIYSHIVKAPQSKPKEEEDKTPIKEGEKGFKKE